MEERQVGAEFLHCARREFPDHILGPLGSVLDGAVREWGTCDGISARVLRPLVERSPNVRAGMVRWSRSPNPWRRGCAAVAFVTEARRGRHSRTIMAVCAGLVAHRERFSQLGMGWLL
jgi:3-methyladenine DNA glycosylase AlkD